MTWRQRLDKLLDNKLDIEFQLEELIDEDETREKLILQCHFNALIEKIQALKRKLYGKSSTTNPSTEKNEQNS